MDTQKELKQTSRRDLLFVGGFFLLVAIVGTVLFYLLVHIVGESISAPPRPDNEVFYRSVWSFKTQLGIKLPANLKSSDIQCYGDKNWMGDGDIECSFTTNKNEVQRMLKEKPNGDRWQKGPYGFYCRAKNECETINIYPGANNNIKIIDSENIYYSVKDRSTSGDPAANYDLYIIDTNTNIVMIKELDA